MTLFAKQQERFYCVFICALPAWIAFFLTIIPSQIFTPWVRNALGHSLYLYLSLQVFIFSYTKLKPSVLILMLSAISLMAFNMNQSFGAWESIDVGLSIIYIYMLLSISRYFKSSLIINSLLCLDGLFFIYSRLMDKSEVYFPLSILGYFFTPLKEVALSSFVFFLLPSVVLLWINKTYLTLNFGDSSNKT